MSRGKVHEVKQGSREWWALRLGIPTVSSFGRIMTEKRLDYSSAAPAYAAELIGERILGRPLDWGVGETRETIWTERGKDMEKEAADWYQLYRGVEAREVGFITIWDDTVGGSPDRLVDEDGIVEIKCRSAKSHARAMMGVDPIAGVLQTHGYLWITGREWLDQVAYNDVLPPRIDRVYRDETIIEAMRAHVARFLNELEEAEAVLEKCGDVIENDGLLQRLAASVKEEKS